MASMLKRSNVKIRQGNYVKISTFVLKLMALIAMLLDHMEGTFPNIFPVVFGWIGRIAIPVFMFCVIQGLIHTSNTRKYLLRLYIGSVVMSVGSFLLQISFVNAQFQIADNIFATFFILAVLIILAKSKLSLNRKVRLWIVFVIIQLLSFLLIIRLQTVSKSLEYLANGLIPNIITNGFGIFILLGILMYTFRNNRLKFSVMYILFCFLMFVIACFSGFTVQNLLFNNYQWMMIIALPLMLAHNGKKGKSLKYFFYTFYPLHIWILFLISTIVQKQ